MPCDRCNYELQVGDYPFCRGNEKDHQGGSYGVTTDDIPGGIEIRHGLVNADGSPRTFYSKSSIAKEAKARGLEQFVRHVGEQGSDKSRHTTRWI